MTPSIKYIDVELDANNFQRDVHKMLDVLRPSWKGAELTMKVGSAVEILAAIRICMHS